MNIKIISPQGGKDEFEFKTDVVTIGRGKNCDIVLADDHISRKHLEIKNIGGIAYIKDLTLANWVSYNDEKLPKELEVQYYDFAPLMLPGQYKVEIDVEQKEINTEEEKIDIFKNKIKPVSMSVKSSPASLAEFDDGDSDFESEEEVKVNPRKARRLKEKKKKQRNELMIIIIVALAAIGFVANEFVIQDDSSKTSLTTKTEQKRKAKPKPKVKKKNRKNSFGQVNKMKHQGKGPDFNSLYSGKKCQSKLESVLCKIIFKNTASQYEGVLIKDKGIIVFKSLSVRGVSILGNVSSLNEHLNSKDKSDSLAKVVAGEHLLSPAILQKIESSSFSSIKVVIFKANKSGPEISHKFHIESSDHRKYEGKQYTRAFSDAKTGNFTFFNQYLARFVREAK